MSQRMRRNGSPIPTSPNTFPPSPGSNTTVATVGSPPSTGASVGTSPGMSYFSRLGPMKATVPFQLKQQQQQHQHQTALMQSNRSLHVSGAVNNSGGCNNNSNGKFHEASSSCAPGERGGGARTSAAATSHNWSQLSRAFPISAADSVLSFPPSLIPLSSPLDHATNAASSDSVSFQSGTSSFLPSNPSPIGNIISLSSSPTSLSSSCLGANSSPSLSFIVPQALQSPPPPPTSPTQQQTTCPLFPTQNNNSSIIPHGLPSSPPCSSPALLSVCQIDYSGPVVTATSQNPLVLSSYTTSSSTISSSSSNPTSTPVTSSPSAPSSCSSSTSPFIVQCSRLVPQSRSPDQDSRTQAAAERSSPSSPAGERTRLALPFPSSSICRTSSLDALTGPYLAGHWPKDGSHTLSCVPCMKDKTTQTPSEWVEEWREEEEEEKRSNHHKRSASWGSTDQLKEIAKLRQQLQRSKHSNRYHRDKDRKSPFNGNHTAIHQPQVPVPRCVLLSLSLVSKANVARFRSSVEGLNQEIERITISHCKLQEDIPDGRRAPPPLLVLQSQSTIASPLHQSQSGMVSRTVDTQTTSSSSNSAPTGNLSNSSSRAQSVSPFFLSAAEEREGDEREKRGEEGEENLCPSEKDQCPGSPLPKFSCSPKPNNSYMFQREPPEGCERVKVFTEDMHSRRPQQAVSPVFLGGPDRNKVNFIPTDSGSAFSILRKPLHS